MAGAPHGLHQQVGDAFHLSGVDWHGGGSDAQRTVMVGDEQWTVACSSSTYYATNIVSGRQVASAITYHYDSANPVIRKIITSGSSRTPPEVSLSPGAGKPVLDERELHWLIGLINAAQEAGPRGFGTVEPFTG
jgi:hypothetical protein